MKKINIIGSTGIIGSKSLFLINKYYPNLKINLLIANKNYKKLINQCKLYNPKYIYLNDKKNIKLLKNKINKKIKILSHDDIHKYLCSSKSDYTIFSISGYQSLGYFDSVIKNTLNLGLVNKECIVSAGHLFKKILNKNKLKIYPLDSQHFSLTKFFYSQSKNDYKNIILTASGGPFFNSSLNEKKDYNFKNAVNHPKWKMGYKNSIDSATLANKCLEIIEAHYLFNIPFSNIDAIIHPEALIHSIIEFNNYTSEMNYFFHDMDIPIINFLNLSSPISKKITSSYPVIRDFDFNRQSKLSFYEINKNKYPVFDIFNQLNKDDPSEFIKFNLANEFAVDLFKDNKIKFKDISKFINKSLSINVNNYINSIKNILDYHINFKEKLKNTYEKF